MSLHVAVVGSRAEQSLPQSALWGTWQAYSASDVTGLATTPDVLSGGTDRLLVLVTRRLAGPASVMASLVAAMRPGLPVRVEALDASSTALSRVVELVSSLPLNANGVVASVQLTLESSTWGAWMQSVAGLNSPAPSVLQHVQSWSPGSNGFLAVGHPDPRVSRLPLQGPSGPSGPSGSSGSFGSAGPGASAAAGAAAAAAAARRRKGPAGLTCVADGELPELAIAALFLLGADSRPLLRAALEDHKAAWGSRRCIEFAITPAAARHPGAASQVCPVCEEPVWGRTCPFCRVAPHQVGEPMRESAVA